MTLGELFLVIVMGWPGAMAGWCLAGFGSWHGSAAWTLAGSLLATPLALYVAAHPGGGWPGGAMLAILGAAVLAARTRRRAAGRGLWALGVALLAWLAISVHTPSGTESRVRVMARAPAGPAVPPDQGVPEP